MPASYRTARSVPHVTDRRAKPGAIARTPPPPPEIVGDGGAKALAKTETGSAHHGADEGHKAGAESTIKASAFLGDFRGEDVSTYKLEGMPEREDRDPNARITVKSSSDNALDIVLVDSSNGKDICTLTATIGDLGATIAAGQKCFEQTGGEASATATIRTGTATIDGRRLIVDLELAFEMHVPDQDAKGTLAYHFDGTRRR